uniref:Uncharacterized protein n=1 Tax=Opuntia streptacantha TaxID=393608 RepID=A0A7C8ZKU0_OPUST
MSCSTIVTSLGLTALNNLNVPRSDPVMSYRLWCIQCTTVTSSGRDVTRPGSAKFPILPSTGLNSKGRPSDSANSASRLPVWESNSEQGPNPVTRTERGFLGREAKMWNNPDLTPK